MGAAFRVSHTPQKYGLAHRARTPQRMIFLVASAVLLSLLCNMVRVTILILLIDHYGLAILDTPIHEISGVATFGVVLVALLAIGDPGAMRRPAS